MNSMKILKISLMVILLVAVVYVVVDMFFKSSNQTRENFSKFSQSVARQAKKSTEGTDKTMVPLDGIMITINGRKYHYMKADMSFKMKNTEDTKILEKNIDDVRDLILRYTALKGSDKLDTDKGKEAYKATIKNLIYHTFGYEVEDIYFRNFVLAP